MRSSAKALGSRTNKTNHFLLDVQNEMAIKIKTLIRCIFDFFYRTKFVDFLTNKGE